ncbi:hypothetical protein ACFX2B_017963 [Malus domestica]
METTAFESVDQVVQEIMRIHRSLPPRPAVDEVEAAVTLVRNVEMAEQVRLDAIARQTKSLQVPEELFMVLQEMQRKLVYFNSKEEMREAHKLLDLENLHNLFDDLIQRASTCVSSPNSTSSSSAAAMAAVNLSSKSNSVSGVLPHRPSPSSSGSAAATAAAYVFNTDRGGVAKTASARVSRDDSFVVSKPKKAFYLDGIGAGPAVSATPQIVDSSLRSVSALNSTGGGGVGGQEGEKLSLIKLASLIEVFAKKGTKDVNLRNKLMDQIEWLPDSIGKLSGLVSLDLSENRILVLPTTIGGLSSLTKLDLHSNRIAQLPDTIGDLLSLVSLDLRANDLTALPATFGRLVRLEELDLSSNRLAVLPDTIGSLASLKTLNVETNDIDEIPHTIGHCTSLKELRADYNRLKALPEAVGKIESLEVLSVRYNNIKQLPTTVSSLLSLRELDVSFNELESVPENLCFATSLVKMNIGNNFADLRSLPRAIGNLEMLEELDISNNQIRVLPDSFRMLTRLRVLRVEENPLEVPPRHIAEKGAQAVVQYMAELVVKRDVKAQPVKQKKTWAQICCFSRSNKRKRNGIPAVSRLDEKRDHESTSTKMIISEQKTLIYDCKLQFDALVAVLGFGTQSNYEISNFLNLPVIRSRTSLTFRQPLSVIVMRRVDHSTHAITCVIGNTITKFSIVNLPAPTMILSPPADSAPSHAPPHSFTAHLSWVELKNTNPSFPEGTFKTSPIPGTLTSLRPALPATKKTGGGSGGGGPLDFRWLAFRTKNIYQSGICQIYRTPG